jgi:uncharacterized protein YbjT (DUF2867 family)
MQQILVTGGAGHLGRLVVKQLSQAGYRVRGMSRRASPGEDWPGAEWKQADLVTGAGVVEAVQGMDTVVHLAGKGNWKVDYEGTRRLVEATHEAWISHLIFISIVGIDRVPWAGGKAKLASEDLIAHSGIPWSTLRATQFHYGIDFLLNFLTRLPLVTLLPTDLLLQPVDEEEVAGHLCEIVQAGPSGRLPDMGGPQVYTLGELARIWLKHRGGASGYSPALSAWQNGQGPAPGRQYLPPTDHRHCQMGSLAPRSLPSVGKPAPAAPWRDVSPEGAGAYVTRARTGEPSI